MLTNIEENDVELYIDHIQYFFSTQTANNVRGLTEQEKVRLFLLVEQNADILSKIILPSTSSMLKYMLGEITKEQIVSPNDIEFIEGYELWKQSQT